MALHLTTKSTKESEKDAFAAILPKCRSISMAQPTTRIESLTSCLSCRPIGRTARQRSPHIVPRVSHPLGLCRSSPSSADAAGIGTFWRFYEEALASIACLVYLTLCHV